MKTSRNNSSFTLSFDQHKENLIKELNFKERPIIYTGDDAYKYAKKHIPILKKKKKIRYGGYFDYKYMGDKFKKTGVVCIFNNEIPTLAHELRHAKQYQDQSWWLINKDELIWLKLFYRIGYFFYPSEVVAFTYTVKYLFVSNERKLALKYLIESPPFLFIVLAICFFCI